MFLIMVCGQHRGTYKRVRLIGVQNNIHMQAEFRAVNANNYYYFHSCYTGKSNSQTLALDRLLLLVLHTFASWLTASQAYRHLWDPNHHSIGSCTGCMEQGEGKAGTHKSWVNIDVAVLIYVQTHIDFNWLVLHRFLPIDRNVR